MLIGNSWDKLFVEKYLWVSQLRVQPSYLLRWERFEMLKSAEESFNLGEVFYCTTIPILQNLDAEISCVVS